MRKQGVVLLSSLLLFAAGCAVHEHKSGDTDNVQIHTPVGGLNVRTNTTHAADLGLPVYPGAVQVTDDGNSKSADVNLSFAGWHLHVQAVHYHSADPQDKIADFYRKAMAQYGGAVTCKDRKPIGEPMKNQLGLTCENSREISAKSNLHLGSGMSESKKSGNRKSGGTALETPPGDFQLISGSTSNQRIVAFEPSSSGSNFALIVLQFPHRDQTD